MVAFDEFNDGEVVPTSMEVPATETPPSLPVVTRLQTLPIDQLTWDNFERLCLRYVRGMGSVDRCQRYGVPGQDQSGIDLYARFRDPARYAVYQCKKVKNFGAREIRAAVDMFVEGKWRQRAKAFTICTSHATESTQIADAIEEVGAHLHPLGIDFDLVGPERLSLWLKDQPSIVDDFFHRAWVSAFCGEEALNKLGDRLNSSDVAALRRTLGGFYNTLFNRHDPGIPIRLKLGDRDIPLPERFVMPDVYASLGSGVGERGGATTSAPKQDGNNGGSKDDGAEKGRFWSGSVEQVKARVVADGWLSQAERSVVLGPPGSGKSVLLRMLTTDLLSERPVLNQVATRWGRSLPVWIPFPYWTSLNSKASAPLSLSECLEQWFKQFDQADTWRLVKGALRDNRLLLLVDGLDEWTDETAARTTSQILQTYIQTRNLSAILVSRPHGFERVTMQGGSWQLGELAPLSKGQQHHLVGKWLTIHAQRNSSALGVEEDQGAIANAAQREFDAFIRKTEESRDLIQLIENPLTLLLLLYLHLQNSPLPENRFAAYKYVTDHFVREHPLNRRSAASLMEDSNMLRPEEFRQVLGHLAYIIQSEFPSGVVLETDVRSRIEAVLKDDGQLGLGLTSGEAREVLRSFTNIEEGALGLLVSQGQGAVSFFHRSLQEYLAAVHISRLPRSEQGTIVSDRLADPRWREVIVALIWLCQGSEDADRLADVIETAAVDPVGELAKHELLAEVSFGDFALSPGRAKGLAAGTCNRIETSFIANHRGRLLSYVLSGLRSRKTRALVQNRVSRWVFSPAFSSNRIRALQTWPPLNHTWEVLYRALHNEEPTVVRVAATVVAALFGGQPNRGEIIADLACRSLSEAQRAACIHCLSEGWPNHQSLHDAIIAGRASFSDTVRIASIAASLNLSQTADSDLKELMRLAYDRYSSAVDFAWRGDIADLLVRGWAGNPLLKEACLNSQHRHVRNPDLLDTSIAQHVLVAAFPQDDEVARFIEAELRNNHPFLPSWGTGSIWANLPIHFRDNPRVVAALDQWALRPEYLDPIALHHAALVGRTAVMKRRLFEALHVSFPFWSVSSLLKGWGMRDAEVAEKLTNRVSEQNADQLAQFIPQILDEKTQALSRLIELLRDKSSQRLDFILEGLASLRPFPKENEAVEAALDRFKQNEWLRERYVSSLIAAFPGDNRVRDLAIDVLTLHEAPLFAIAEAYASSEEMRAKVGELMTPLPTDLRYKIVTDLPSLGDSAFALGTLSRWDSEANAEVKTQAAIQFHVLLDKLNLPTQSALEYLLKLLPCYGPDHEERRHAAAAGLIALRRLDLIVGKQEQIGYEGKQINVPIPSGLGRNRVFLSYLASNWIYAKTAVANDLEVFKARIGSADSFWSDLALVAAEQPALARDVISHAQSNPEFEKSASYLLLAARLEPRSERLASLCLAAIRNETHRHDWFDAVEAAAILLSEHFRGDAKIEARLLQLGTPHQMPVGAVMAICLGWPRSQSLDGFEVVEEEPWAHETGPLYVKYAKCASDDLGRLLERELLWAQRNSWHSKVSVRPLVARIKNDQVALDCLSAALFATDSLTLKATIPRLLSIAGSFTVERDSWCRKELLAQRQNHFSEFGFDLVAGSPRSLTLCLLESLGEAKLTDRWSIE